MRRVRLGDVVEITNGFAFDSKKFNDFGAGLPLVRIRDVVPRRTSTYFDGAYPPGYLVQNGDLLIGMDGEFNIETWNGGKALLNQRVCKVVAVQNLTDSRYIKYLLAPILKRIEIDTPYVTVKHLSSEKLKAQLVNLPPLPEQRRIAALLDKADRLRRLRRYALELSDTYLQSVFLEMFGGLFGQVEKVCLQDLLVMPLQNGLFETNDKYGTTGYPVIWVDDLYHTISVDVHNLRRLHADTSSLSRYEVKPGDLLFTRSSLVREGVGHVNIVPDIRERTAFECHIIRARVDNSRVNPFYLLELFRSPYGRAAVMQRAKTATMTTIGQDDIGSLPCPIPPKQQQDAFSSIVTKVERLRFQQREALRQAEHLFQTLLHQAFAMEG